MEKTPPAVAGPGPAHLAYGDPLRNAACFAVLAAHACAKYFNIYHYPPNLDWWGSLPMVAFSRWTVPVFIMLSGALILDPARHESTKAFLKKRADRLLIPTLAWPLIFIAFHHLVLGDRYAPRHLVDVFVHGTQHAHIYYLYVIWGLYLVAPGLRIIVSSLDRRTLLYLIALAGTLAFAHSMDMIIIENKRPLAQSFVLTMFVPYVFYFLLGYYLRGFRLTGRWWGLTLAGVIVAGLVVGAGTYFCFAKFGPGARGRIFLDFFNPLMIAMSAGAFLLFTGLGGRALSLLGGGPTPNRWAKAFAEASLGVYLIHPIFNFGLNVCFDRLHASGLVRMPLMILLLPLACFIVIRLLAKVPYLKRLVA